MSAKYPNGHDHRTCMLCHKCACCIEKERVIRYYEKALRGIAYHCCGYSPEHLGADDYKDPGVKMAREIIDAMRAAAREAIEETQSDAWSKTQS